MASIYKLKGDMNKKTKVYLRYNATSEWRNQALKKANYKCEISGKKSCAKNKLVVHHLTKPFEEIVKEAHQQLHITYHKTIDKYKEEDLKALVELVKEMHKNVGAIILTEYFHNRIHDLFGSNPTPEQVKSYKKSYRRQIYKVRNITHNKTA